MWQNAAPADLRGRGSKVHYEALVITHRCPFHHFAPARALFSSTHRRTLQHNCDGYGPELSGNCWNRCWCTSARQRPQQCLCPAGSIHPFPPPTITSHTVRICWPNWEISILRRLIPKVSVPLATLLSCFFPPSVVNVLHRSSFYACLCLPGLSRGAWF